jgi:CRISPR-associated endonuclease Csy4
MDHYIDITIQPDAEMRENILLNKVFTKLHKALWDLNSVDIGVSFPSAKTTLGGVLRIHSTDKRIMELNEKKWLGGLSGYCLYSEIQPIPSAVQYMIVSRWQHNMSESHLRRLIKRGSIAEEEIKVYRTKMFKNQMTTLPFLEVESSSNGNHHRRYIKVSETLNTPSEGKFDSFGLSKSATIPKF